MVFDVSATLSTDMQATPRHVCKAGRKSPSVFSTLSLYLFPLPKFSITSCQQLVNALESLSSFQLWRLIVIETESCLSR